MEREPVLVAAVPGERGSNDPIGPIMNQEELIDDKLSAQLALARDDPRRMKLTQEEHEWSLEIKDMIEGMPDLDDLSDFMYAQLALITRGRLDEAVDRAYGLQEFVREYQVVDEYQEGCQLFKWLVDLFPRQLLSWGFNEQEGAYVLTQDVSQFDTSDLRCPKKFNNFMRAAYYLHSTQCADLQSIRKGAIILVECKNVDWTRKQDYKVFGKMFSQLLTHYPIKPESLRHYHTGMVINVLTSMVKTVMPKELKDALRMGCQADQTLDALYLVPDLPTANQRFLRSMERSLKRRYDNEKSFSLDSN